jgi:hypothetical protein
MLMIAADLGFVGGVHSASLRMICFPVWERDSPCHISLSAWLAQSEAG